MNSLKTLAKRAALGASAVALLPVVALAQTQPAETDYLQAVADKATAVTGVSLPTLVGIAVTFIGVAIVISMVLKSRRVAK